MHACMCPCLQWKEANLGCYSSDNLGCFSPQGSILHFFWNSSFKLYWMVKSSRDTPVSTYPVLGNQVHTTIPRYLYRLWGPNMHNNHFNNWDIFSAPPLLFFLAYGFVCLLCHVTAQLTPQARGPPDLLVILTHGSWKTSCRIWVV